MDFYTRIIAISLYSNEIEIGGPLFLKDSPDSARHSLKCHFFMTNNFTFIPAKDLHELGLAALKRNKTAPK